MKNIRLMVLSIGIILTSCNKILDVQPEDFLNPERCCDTEIQLNYTLNGVYSTLAGTGLYGNFMQGRLGLDADIGYNTWGTDDFTVGDYYVVPADSKIINYWRTLYEGVNRANLLLENIHKADIDEDTRNVIKGEALFLRAYFYFMLTIRFGDVPLILNTIKGKPTVETLQVPATKSKEIYEKVLADMEEASMLVKDITEIQGGGRVSKSAVWGIMARVCLYMAGKPLNQTERYEDAKKWAEKVMAVTHHELNPSYQQVFINYIQDKYDTKESIWEVEFWGNGTGLYNGSAGSVGSHNGIGATEDPRYGYSRGVVRTTDWFYRLFESGDKRGAWSIASFRYSGDPAEVIEWPATQIYDRYCGKFRRVYELITPKEPYATPINFPILRYADVLLMYAEADFMAGNQTPTDNARTAINKVRRRAYGFNINSTTPTPADLPVLSAVDFYDALKDERARELGFELLRKDDIIRWGEFLTRMKAIHQHAESVNGTRTVLVRARKYYKNASARDVLWPIPYAELNVNKKLVQNPGW